MTTIFAPATAPGRAGVSVIRISGPQADQTFDLLGITTPPKARKATLVTLKHPKTGELIDKALILWFPAPHSFTGENIVELHLHGSRATIAEIMEVLHLPEAFRLAEPGEFSRQALYNNKMDLAETEGLADLIDAETSAQKKQALRQIEGHLSTICNELRSGIIHARAHIEAYLDFPDEEVPDSVMGTIHKDVTEIQNKITTCLDSAKHGEKIREGYYATIIGAPNAGKSTLINALSKRDVAIVSDIAGTTRDILEVHLNLDGYAFTLADTAGIRNNPDAIESEGIRRALERAKQSDITIYLFDGTNITDEATVLNNINQQNAVVVINKSDLLPQDVVDKWEKEGAICISAKAQLHLEKLVSYLKSTINGRFVGFSDPVITRARHRKAFEEAHSLLGESLGEDALELKAELLRLAAQHLGKVTGSIHLEDVLDELFSTFCIGK